MPTYDSRYFDPVVCEVPSVPLYKKYHHHPYSVHLRPSGCMYVSLSTYISRLVSRFIGRLVYLPACLYSVHLSDCTWVFLCASLCVPICLPTYLLVPACLTLPGYVCLLSCTISRRPACLYVCLSAFMSTCLQPFNLFLKEKFL